MNEEKKQPMGMNIGSASIVMVFAVLCLTIFSVLSLVTAHHEWQLVQKSANAVTNYYQADLQAEKQYAEIVAGLAQGKSLAELGEGITITAYDQWWQVEYTVKIDEEQNLQVVLQINRQTGESLVQQWQVVAAKEWVFDDSMAVWDGE